MTDLMKVVYEQYLCDCERLLAALVLIAVRSLCRVSCADLSRTLLECPCTTKRDSAFSNYFFFQNEYFLSDLDKFDKFDKITHA